MNGSDGRSDDEASRGTPGGRTAFIASYPRFLLFVRNYVSARLGAVPASRVDLSGLVQSVLKSFYFRIPEGASPPRSENHQKNLLRRIADNKVVDQRRMVSAKKRGNAWRIENEPSNLADLAEDRKGRPPDAEAAASEDLAELRRRLGGLSLRRLGTVGDLDDVPTRADTLDLAEEKKELRFRVADSNGEVVLNVVGRDLPAGAKSEEIADLKRRPEFSPSEPLDECQECMLVFRILRLLGRKHHGHRLWTVAVMMAAAYKEVEIANALGVAVRTVQNDKERIRDVLDPDRRIRDSDPEDHRGFDR